MNSKVEKPTRLSATSAQLREAGGVGPVEGLDHVRPELLRVTNAAADKYAARHGGDPRTAAHGLRTCVQALLADGHHSADDDGYHYLYADGYRVVLAPDTTTVVGYNTAAVAPTIWDLRGGDAPDTATYRNARITGRGGAGALDRDTVLDGETVDVDQVRMHGDSLSEAAAYYSAPYAEVREKLRTLLEDALEAAEDDGDILVRTDRGWAVQYDGWNVELSADTTVLLAVTVPETSHTE